MDVASALVEPAIPQTPRLRLVRSPAARQLTERPAGAAGAGQTVLDLRFVMPGGLPAVPEAPADVWSPAPRRCPREQIEQVGPPTQRAALPPAGPWAARLAQAVLEVCTAGRPVNQLLRWTDPAVYQELERRYAPRASRDARQRRVRAAERIRSIHLCEPADGVAEVCALIVGGERPRAMALRIEGWRGRWVCNVLEWI